jgi:hypothetical protein
MLVLLFNGKTFFTTETQRSQGFAGKIPNPKHQMPNNLQKAITKIPNPASQSFENWILEIGFLISLYYLRANSGNFVKHIRYKTRCALGIFNLRHLRHLSTLKHTFLVAALPHWVLCASVVKFF